MTGTISFINHYDSTDSSAFIADINAAETLIQTLFSPPNSVTVNVAFTEAYSSTSGDVLSNQWPSGVFVSYSTLKAHLPSSDTNLPSTDPDPAGGNDWYLPEAYARILGLSSSAPSIDDTVTLNTYYIDHPAGSTPLTFGQDVINGLVHELSEGVMGRIGGLGDLLSANGTSFGPYFSTMDLFRYSAPGVHDYTDGRDGSPTYFSSNGTTLSSSSDLSFNNDYDGSTRNNKGDVADWTQQDVFGTTGGGETLTLTQTELDVMAALGYSINLPQDIFASSTADDWQTPLDWSMLCMPITPQDAFIGVLGAANVTSNNDVTVNSIGTNDLSSLTISSDSDFTATSGTSLNAETTSHWDTGNFGSIIVDAGATFTVGNAASFTTFDNAGSIKIGASSSASGVGYFDIVGNVTLDGAGVLVLGSSTSTGTIYGDYLANVDNVISGSGLVSLNNILNSSTLAATQNEGNTLEVSASTFYNTGTMIAEVGTTLTLSANGNAIGDLGGTLLAQGGLLAIDSSVNTGAYYQSGQSVPDGEPSRPSRARSLSRPGL